MEYAVEINSLNKSYGEFMLRDVSFRLPSGFIMGFAGQNGAGKTTVIKSILNMIKRDSGDIKVFGKDNIADEAEIKQNIGVVTDDFFFMSHFKLKDIDAQLKLFYNKWNSGTFKAYTQRFRLPENTPCGKFSKGMKMKLMIAAALSHEAELIILDEPTSGLDPVARDEFLDIITEYIESGNRSVLFSTHITSDLERIADYITLIRDGGIIFTGEKDELLEKYIVIKGDEADLNEEARADAIGFHNYRNGFEALFMTENAQLLPDSIITERASIDDILIFTAKENAQ